MSDGDLRLIRFTLALLWLFSGMLSFGLYPVEQSLAMLERLDLRGPPAFLVLYGASTLDLALGMLTLSWPSHRLWRVQAALVLAYTVIITVWLPEFWLHPFGPVLKNLPVLVLLWLLHQYERRAP